MRSAASARLTPRIFSGNQTLRRTFMCGNRA